MERKPVTLTADLSRLIDGGIHAGEFSGRSAAIRRCLREYFRTHLVETAALLAADDDLDVEAVAEALELDHEHLVDAVTAIDQNREPASTETVLEEIVGDFRVGEPGDETTNRTPPDENEPPSDS